jgi:hypothetical protein
MAVVLQKALLLHGEAGPLTRPSSQSNQRGIFPLNFNESKELQLSSQERQCDGRG